MEMRDFQQGFWAEKELEGVRKRLRELDAEREGLAARCRELEELVEGERKRQEAEMERRRVVQRFSPAEKIAIFRGLFRGREDVYAKRFESKKTGKSGYQPVCNNEWVPGFCEKPRVKCSECAYRRWRPLTDGMVEMHLRGGDPHGRDVTLGVYPMLEGDMCWFLAVDFDEADYEADVQAFLSTCRKWEVPASIERSRSGKGAHVWVFFEAPVAARTARQMGAFLLTETMEDHPQLGFRSYDRFFPNQDKMPSGGFGNLIALPLQGKPRREGNSVFVDETFTPYEDQWGYLAGIRRMRPDEVEALAHRAVESGRVTGVQMPLIEDGEEEDNAERSAPWDLAPSRPAKALKLKGLVETPLDIVLGNELYFTKSQLPARLHTAMPRLAAFQNPEFYRAQSMRMPTYDKPRIISCTEDYPEHIGLPRGCKDAVLALLEANDIPYTLTDKRNEGSRQDFQFHGTLRPEQKKAADAMLPHDDGVLSATMAFGKTVLGTYMLAQRNTNALVLVPRIQLLHQWRDKLKEFLHLGDSQIGMIGGGKRKVTGIVDVASVQSLVHKGVVDDIVGEYGMVVCDECHHFSAFSFESVIRRCKCRYVLGLSATITRKDGHHPIIFMQCGPVRYRVNDIAQATQRPFEHYAIIRHTDLRLPMELASKEKLTIHDIYDLMIHNAERNAMLVEDVKKALAEGRNPVVLTERKEHLAWLEQAFAGTPNLFVMRGGMQRKKLEAILQAYSDVPEGEQRLLLATGRFLGEGFDDNRLDTLFLTMPISWRGTLAQYAGRLHRLHERKTDVKIYDYADTAIAMTSRMLERRISGYRAIGYRVLSQEPLPLE